VDSEEDAAPPIGRSAEPPGGSETVLLVEDEETVRTVAARVLASRGYVVHKAANGKEALELARKLDGTVDLVLTDVVMPDMGGVELVARLLELWPELKVVYMSGYAQGDKLEPESPRVERSFLQKPFSSESLTLKVREVLDRVTGIQA
jgi:two-component system cell cycle sensor histidine kinase/response regulator CckA